MTSVVVKIRLRIFIERKNINNSSKNENNGIQNVAHRYAIHGRQRSADETCPNYYLISLLQNPFIIVSDKCETFFCELGKMYGPLKIFAGGKN